MVLLHQVKLKRLHLTVNIVRDSSTVVVNANAGTVTANVTGTLTGDTKASDNQQ